MTQEELEEMLGDLCDNYCKYPNILKFEELLYKCEECPLNKLKDIMKEVTDA